MSLSAIIKRIESERELNKMLEQRLQEQIEADLIYTEDKRKVHNQILDEERDRLIQRRADIAQEFAERDAALARLIADDQKPKQVAQEAKPEPQEEEAADAA